MASTLAPLLPRRRHCRSLTASAPSRSLGPTSHLASLQSSGATRVVAPRRNGVLCYSTPYEQATSKRLKQRSSLRRSSLSRCRVDVLRSVRLIPTQLLFLWLVMSPLRASRLEEVVSFRLLDLRLRAVSRGSIFIRLLRFILQLEEEEVIHQENLSRVLRSDRAHHQLTPLLTRSLQHLRTSLPPPLPQLPSLPPHLSPLQPNSQNVQPSSLPLPPHLPQPPQPKP